MSMVTALVLCSKHSMCGTHCCSRCRGPSPARSITLPLSDTVSCNLRLSRLLCHMLCCAVSCCFDVLQAW